ncbi:MAG: AAC(3) family N-acetyltransferase [Ignavibacterium sp.]|nr:AAC(3) family N-acetyltransferase [Ignavibacterium sp.]
MHSSFSKIKNAFPDLTPEESISALKDIVTEEGSIIFPAFTYCFKTTSGDYEVFDNANSKSKVGMLSERFRISEGVIRTSSPTHSFALWGKIINDIDESNSPESPLGKKSVMEWLTNNPESFVLILGTDFSSLTYGHYLEIEASVPWYNHSPWNYMNVLPIGVSIKGEHRLKEIPGCAKGFVNFEKYLLENNLIKKCEYKSFSSYFINVKLLYNEGLIYFSNYYENLLCGKNTCPACDSRRRKFL